MSGKSTIHQFCVEKWLGNHQTIKSSKISLSGKWTSYQSSQEKWVGHFLTSSPAKSSCPGSRHVIKIVRKIWLGHGPTSRPVQATGLDLEILPSSLPGNRACMSSLSSKSGLCLGFDIKVKSTPHVKTSFLQSL